MLMTKERPRTIRTLRGWAINVLQEAGAIHECKSTAGRVTGPTCRERAFRFCPVRSADRRLIRSSGR